MTTDGAPIHGLAGKIRTSTESDTFDLAGLSESTIQQVVMGAFQQPFTNLSDMIRLTLIVGAGKLGRQKYDANATKIVTQTLQSVGFTEDRGASAIVECAGSYKLQHETGKNLKTVVVFPLLPSSSTKSGGGNNGAGGDDNSPIVDPDSVVYRVAISSMATFSNMVQHKCPTWFEKRTLLHDVLIEQIDGPLKECERLLLSGQPLTPSQDEFYNTTCVSIEDKKQLVKDEMHKQIFDPPHDQLTQDEMNYLLEHVQERINELESSSSSGSGPLQKAKERQQKLQTISTFLKPKSLPPLKHHAQLSKLWKQASPLMPLHFQRNNGGKLMTPAETKKLAQLDDILDEIDQLEQDSRGWFESDDVFMQRLQSSRREFQSKYGGDGSGKKGGGQQKKASTNIMTGSANRRKGTAVTSSDGFVSTAVLPNSRGGRGGTNAWGMSAADKKAMAIKAKKSRLQKGDVFGAMMADDDDESSSEEEDDAKDEKVSPSEDTASAVQSSQNTSKPVDKKKGGGKKKDNDDDKLLDAAIRANQEAATDPISSSSGGGGGGKSSQKKKNKKNKMSNSNSDSKASTEKGKATDDDNGASSITSVLLAVINFLWMILASILTWLIGTLFGTSSKQKKKQKKS